MPLSFGDRSCSHAVSGALAGSWALSVGGGAAGAWLAQPASRSSPTSTAGRRRIEGERRPHQINGGGGDLLDGVRFPMSGPRVGLRGAQRRVRVPAEVGGPRCAYGSSGAGSSGVMVVSTGSHSVAPARSSVMGEPEELGWTAMVPPGPEPTGLPAASRTRLQPLCTTSSLGRKSTATSCFSPATLVLPLAGSATWLRLCAAKLMLRSAAPPGQRSASVSTRAALSPPAVTLPRNAGTPAMCVSAATGGDTKAASSGPLSSVGTEETKPADAAAGRSP